MGTILRDIKIKYKLWAVVGVMTLGIVIVGVMYALSLRTGLFAEKQLKTRHLVETAYGVVDYFYSISKEGKISEKEAQASAIAAVKNLRYEDKDYFWINDMRPRMIMHPFKPELDGTDISDFKDPTGKALFVSMVEVVKNSKAGFVNYMWPKPNYKDPVPKISYVKGFEPWGWVIGSGIYVDDVNAIVRKEVLKIAVVLIIIVGISLFIASSIIGGLLKQLGGEPGYVADIVKKVADGDLRIDIKTQTKYQDSLLSSVDSMVVRLKQMMGDIKSTSDTLASASQELSASAEQMSRGVTEQSGRANQIATASAEMSQTIIDIAKNSSNIASSAAETVKVANDGEKVVDKSVEEVRAIASTVNESAVRMSSLGDRSKQIGEILNVIKDIADQTNLLALNAAIEAARAGEQGRGFAVVADEVRKLAERTGKATSEIGGMISGIQSEMENAVVSMEAGTKKVETGVKYSASAGDALRNIVGSVSELQTMVQQIATATEEMSTTSEQISGDIETIANVSNETSASSGQISKASSDLARLAGDLQNVVGLFRV
ncbi:MAG TPA: methyl-accepting chemotaxis protein [Thermodesulfovibrionales bacterium]|nr:methyl-accepting chemotaxis protein [Thermodesulfovibrionales bacterium]